MARTDVDNLEKPEEEKREERYFRFTLFPPSYEVRGYDIQDTLILLKRTWWLYLLMPLALIGIVLIVIYLKDVITILASSLTSVWLKK